MKQHHSKEAGRKTAKGGADGSTTTSKVVLPLHLSVLPCSPLLVGGVLPSSSSIVGLWCIPPVCIHIFAHPLDLFVSDQNKQGGQNGEKTARPPKRGSHQHHPKERRGRHPKGKMEKYLGGKEHTPNNEERRTTKREHSSHHQRRKGGKHHSKEGCTQKQHPPTGGCVPPPSGWCCFLPLPPPCGVELPSRLFPFLWWGWPPTSCLGSGTFSNRPFGLCCVSSPCLGWCCVLHVCGTTFSSCFWVAVVPPSSFSCMT